MSIRSWQAVVASWSSISIGRRIFTAAAVIAAVTLFVKLTAFGREMLVANYFGRADALEAYLIASTPVMFVIYLFGSSLSVALIPVFVQLREQQGQAAANRLVADVVMVEVSILLLVTLAVLLLAPFYLPWLAIGFDSGKLALTQQILYGLAPVILLSGLIAVWSSLLNACEQFAFPAITPIVTPLLTIVLLLSSNRLGITALLVGTLVGALVEATLLASAIRRRNLPLWPTWHGFTEPVRRVLGQYWPAVASAFLMGNTDLVDRAMASALAPGSVSALNYGMRLIWVPLTLASTALGTALLPYMSLIVAKQEWQVVRQTLHRYLLLIVLTTVPVTLILLLLSPNLVRLVFERGAFTAQDTAVVALVQAAYALQIPFYVAGILVVRMISSIQANSILMWVAGFNLLSNILLNYLFMQWYGVAGIALSTAVVMLQSFLLCWYLLARKLSELEGRVGDGRL
jgi:putative peptidoglycan lipid II flippase